MSKTPSEPRPGHRQVARIRSGRRIEHAVSKRVRTEINGLGLDSGTSQSHIIPIIFGDSKSVLKAAEKLRNEGIFVPAIRPPSVPENQARLRISLCADHTPEQVDLLLETLAKT